MAAKPAADSASSSGDSSSSDESEKPAPKKKPAKAASSSEDDSDSGSGSDSDSDEPKPKAKKAAAKDDDSDSSSGSSSSDEEEEKADEGKKKSRKNSEAKAQPVAAKADPSDPNFGKLELFVQALNFDTTEESLRAFFSPYGTMTKCKLFFGKGKAFVEFETHEQAKTALENTNEKALDGRTIWVEFSGQAAGGYKPGQGGGDGQVTTLFVGNLAFSTR